jgi:hypothetical protein
MLFFEVPEDARWNDERDCIEFSVILRPYEGRVRVPRRVFQGLLDQSPTTFVPHPFRRAAIKGRVTPIRGD